MSEIKVYYFDLRARGECIRLVLEAAGKKYEDNRITFDQWPSLKANSPYGQLPYVVYKGKSYGQTVAIANFFAREFGLYGASNLDGLRIDEVVGLSVDLIDEVFKAKFEKDESKKAELSKKLWEETVPQKLSSFQKLLKENGSNGFFVGKAVTLADLFLYNVTDSLIAEKAEAAQSFPPEVAKLRSAVESHPSLKKYLASRKSAPF